MNYVEAYKSVLDFHRKYSNIQDSEGFWQSAVDESDEIFRKYGKCEFVKDLLLAVLAELERKAKKQRGVESK